MRPKPRGLTSRNAGDRPAGEKSWPSPLSRPILLRIGLGESEGRRAPRGMAILSSRRGRGASSWMVDTQAKKQEGDSEFSEFRRGGDPRSVRRGLVRRLLCWDHACCIISTAWTARNKKKRGVDIGYELTLSKPHRMPYLSRTSPLKFFRLTLAYLSFGSRALDPFRGVTARSLNLSIIMKGAHVFCSPRVRCLTKEWLGLPMEVDVCVSFFWPL